MSQQSKKPGICITGHQAVKLTLWIRIELGLKLVSLINLLEEFIMDPHGN